jgi:hypothetical protein
MSPLSPQGRRLFELARGQDQPDEVARNRVARALSLKIAAGAAVTAAGASTTALGAVVAKSALVLGISGALVGGGWFAWRTFQPAPPAAESISSAPRIARPAAPAIHEEDEPTLEPPSPSATKEPVKAPVYRRTVRPATPAEPAAHATAPAEDGLREETAALRLAQQALREKDPEQALQLLDEQDRRFQTGLLPQERAAARIMALCQAGRVEEARTQASRFERQWPRSPLLGRVRSACWER